MAFSVIDTHIQNPARKGAGKGRKVATKARRKLSAKQIKAGFGGKRRKLAARKSGPRKKHAPRSTPRKRSNPSFAKKVASYFKAPKRKTNSAPKKRRKNPTPMIISWAAGNPAKRSNMAQKKRRKVAVAKRSNAGRRRAPKKVMHHRKRRSNPGSIGSPMNWIQGGAGVLVGVVGARALPQLVLNASNTGAMGYAANAVAAAGLGFLSHMLFPRNPVITASVVAGGFAALFARIISDQTPYGSALSLTGLGDYGLGLYQPSNYMVPQRIQNGRLPSRGSSMFYTGTQMPGASSVPSMANAGSDSSAAC